MNSKVDAYIAKESKWQEELKQLRTIALSCLDTEEYKWASPCYSYKGSNVIGIRAFKEHCALWFFKGTLLNDTNKILIQSGENTQAMRQVRFSSLSEINNLEQTLKAYIFEAIELEKSGIKVEFKKDTEVLFPEEFKLKLDAIPELKIAFEKLSPGKQREYARHFSEPKRSETRTKRVDKCLPMIIDGIGLNDKYRC